MAHLKYLLSSKEGRDYVALRLVDAFHEHEEIRPGLPRAPYPCMTLDGISRDKSEDLARRAHLVLHVNKSRDTDQGWVVVEEFPTEFIKSLPPTLEVEQHSLNKTLGEVEHLRAQVTRLQEHNTELTLKNRELKNRLPAYEAYQKDKGKLDGETIHRLQMENTALQGYNRNLETSLRDTRVDCVECGASYPIDEKLVCLECFNRVRDHARKYNEEIIGLKQKMVRGQVECEECGDDIPAEEDAYCDACRQKVLEELEVSLEHIKHLEQLLGQAVVDLNKAGKPDSPWVQKYKKLHEKYLHQTSTGQVVDYSDEVVRLQGLNTQLRQERDHLKAKLESAQCERQSAEQNAESMVKMYDTFAEDLIDVLLPHFYNVSGPVAQGGADTDQIISSVEKLVAKCAPCDFQQQLEMHFEDGLNDAEIADRYEMNENEHAEALIALHRVRWEKSQ